MSKPLRPEPLTNASYGKLLAGTYLEDIWDFDFTGTRLVLNASQNAFLVGGAKMQAGHMGSDKPEGAIYLNRFELPQIDLPSSTDCQLFGCFSQ